MNLEKTTVKIGLERPVKLLHVTDTHIALADERDDERKRALANRLGDPDKEKYLWEQIAYAHADGTGQSAADSVCDQCGKHAEDISEMKGGHAGRRGDLNGQIGEGDIA